MATSVASIPALMVFVHILLVHCSEVKGLDSLCVATAIVAAEECLEIATKEELKCIKTLGKKRRKCLKPCLSSGDCEDNLSCLKVLLADFDHCESKGHLTRNKCIQAYRVMEQLCE